MRNYETNDLDDLMRLLAGQPELAERLKPAPAGKDISELPANVAALSRAVRGLSATTGRLSPALDRLSDRMAEAEGHLGNLEVGGYEDLAEPKLIARAMLELGMRPRTVLSRKGNANPRFTSLLQDAMDRIAETQNTAQVRKAAQALSQIHNADLIIEGQGPTYAVCEISITVERHDVERALERASALRWLSGAEAKPVVVGATIPDDERQHAQAGGDEVFSLPNR
jgi:hypothetical protein